MQTIIHQYYFNIENADEAAAYQQLCQKLKAAGLECFESWGGKLHYHGASKSGPVTLKTNCLFNNQWNTTDDSETLPSYRVFDWAQDFPAGKHLTNKSIKRGHYLEQTDEMRAIRNDMSKCGYCGHMAPTGEHVFCPKCLGSEYLKKDDLKLTRMRKISEDSKYKAPDLTPEELAERLPLYEAAQQVTREKRAKQRLADMIESREKARADAEVEFQGFKWLLDRAQVELADNCIYYKHTGRFCFGWRTPIGRENVPDILTEFPFDYDIK